jgi:predicted SprT family Zn-dependent metalloprotease
MGVVLTKGLQGTSHDNSRLMAQNKIAEDTFGTAVQRQSAGECDEMPHDKLSPSGMYTQLQFGESEAEKYADTATVDAIRKRQKKEGNLPEQLRTRMQTSYGADFSDVKIHESSHLAKDLNAKAYTQGNEIHFAPGEYSPGTAAGQEILSHELSHVIQQREGRAKATHQEKGYDISDQVELENEADRHAKIATSGGKIGGFTQQKSRTQLGSVQKTTQKKNGPLQLYQSLPSGVTILGIKPDLDNIYLACSNLAYRVERRVAGYVNWGAKIGREVEGPLSASSLAPIRKSFTETEGINFDWTVSIGWRINNPRPVGGTSTSQVTRTGGGSVSQTSGTSSSETATGEVSGSVGGHEGAAGAGAKGGVSSTRGETESQGVTLQGGVTRAGQERAQSYTAELVASITVSGSANFSGSDYANPFKWGTSIGSAITTSGAQSGSYHAGTVEYRDSRPT